ncbi:MAG: cell division protein FtsZ [Chromatiales bacterium]|nr:cell division protein FtsZ [Chromatiales bacterium]
MIELAEDKKPRGAVIKVIGVGGCGCNTVNYMMSKRLEDVDFICANTDVQALSGSTAQNIQLGADLTKGLGAGGSPQVGNDAAKENADQIRQVVEGCDMLFITAGMGGGTGSGASPVIAEIAKEHGVLTVAVVIKPFEYEKGKRMEIAEHSVAELSKHVDSLIVISNEKLCSVVGVDTELEATMEKAHDVLYSAVQGVAELITRKGLINLDFADIKTVMSASGRAMISSGSAEGDDRASEAIDNAIQNPLLEDMDLRDVRGLLVNISSANITVKEIKEIGDRIGDIVADDADFKMGVVADEDMGGAIRVTVVATGINTESDPQTEVESATVATEVQPESVTLTAIKGGNESSSSADAEKGGNESSSSVDAEVAFPKQQDKDEQYNKLLDIPAFLRNQVD